MTYGDFLPSVDVMFVHLTRLSGNAQPLKYKIHYLSLKHTRARSHAHRHIRTLTFTIRAFIAKRVRKTKYFLVICLSELFCTHVKGTPKPEVHEVSRPIRVGGAGDDVGGS